MLKTLTLRLTVNIIASTAFGFQINAYKDDNNEFYLKAKKAITFTGKQQMKMFILELFPKVAKIFKMSLFDKDFIDYFMHLVLDTMKYRAEHNIYRPDMINLLLEARGMIPTDIIKSHFQEWSDIEVVAQCFLFFFAGMEPSSNTMCFCVHELMEHPSIQQKLYEEIQSVSDDLADASISYEILQKLRYMDQFVCEILRKWPVTLLTDRLCSKDFIYEANGEKLEIKKGDVVRVACVAYTGIQNITIIQKVIDPERFNDENKSKIDAGTYLPFGLGPRNCIANRFATMEIKAFLYHLIRDYRVEASAKTMQPLELKKSGFNLIPDKGFWLQFIPRK
ncbi:hypothetical protein DOY81_013242 [Sarcophaga bullata]|nr:hypothetical protein DOY81_013242 [Sarcophaga bullata]